MTPEKTEAALDEAIAYLEENGFDVPWFDVEFIDRVGGSMVFDDGSMRPDLDPLKVALSLWGQSAGILQIASNKGAMLEMMLGLKPEDLIAYSFEMIRKYLENNEK